MPAANSMPPRLARSWATRGTRWGLAARKEFSAALLELTAAPSNTPALREELELVKQQWFFFENALNQRASADKTLATNVATTSERILQAMESVVGQYEKISK